MADARSGPSLIHKSSVNCPDSSSDEIEFPLPYFVFSEKIRAGAVVCKNVTLVTPLHLIGEFSPTRWMDKFSDKSTDSSKYFSS